MKTSFFILLMVLTIPFFVLAADEPSGNVDAVRIVVDESSEGQGSVSNRDILNKIENHSADDFSFTYDPAQLTDAQPIDINFNDLEKLSTQMETAEYKKKLETEFVIPISTSAENLKESKELSPEELKVFVSKKTRYLQQVVGLFKFIKLAPHYTNKIIAFMNQRLFKKAALVADANAKVFSLQIGVGGGIGFNDWIMHKLKSSPYFKDLPDRAGFYFLLNTGISIVKVTRDGKTKFSIEPVIEKRKGEKFFSPFIYVAAGLTASYTMENRNMVEAIQRAEFYKVSSATIIEGFKQFGISAAAAAVLPPGGGAISGIEGSVTRIRMTPALLVHFVELVRDGARKKLSSMPFCSRFFRDGK